MGGMGKGMVHKLHPSYLVGCMDLNATQAEKKGRAPCCSFMVESVAVLLRGGLSMGTLCNKCGVLELNTR